MLLERTTERSVSVEEGQGFGFMYLTPVTLP